MTNSVSRSFSSSYELDESFLRVIETLCSEVASYNTNQERSLADIEFKASFRAQNCTEEEAVVATKEIFERNLKYSTNIKTKVKLKNGIERKNIDLSNLKDFNCKGERCIEEFTVSIGARENLRSVHIRFGTGRDPIFYNVSGDYDWVELTDKRLAASVNEHRVRWAVFSAQGWIQFMMFMPLLCYCCFGVFKILGFLDGQVVSKVVKLERAQFLDTWSNGIGIGLFLTMVVLFTRGDFFSKKWSWVFPKLSFNFGEAAEDYVWRSKIRGFVLFAPFTLFLIPWVVNQL